MTNWVRLWEDMPTDPKWRSIARRCGQSVGNVMAVFNFMMVNAGANTAERGVLLNWDDEDVATALDVDAEVVFSIRTAMQGKVLEGDRLKGWEKRQPKREDASSSRVAAFRERKKRDQEAGNAPETHCNAPETETETETETELKDESLQDSLSTPLAMDASPADELKIKREAKRAECQELLRQVGEGWNELAASIHLPQIEHLTSARKASILARAKDFREVYGFTEPVDGFRELFSRIRGSPFLRGETGKFRADFDFAVKQSSFTKIMENKYADQQEARYSRK